MADLSVSVRISAFVDQMVAAVGKAKESVAGFGSAVTATKEKLQKADRSLADYAAGCRKASQAMGIAGGAMLALGASLEATAGAALYMGAKFERSMRNVNSIAKMSEADFKSLYGTVATLGAKLGTNQGPQQLAEALYDINSSGFTGAEGLKVLEASAKAASAGVAEASDAAAVITQSLNAYGVGADQAARFSDIMFKTVEAGVVSFAELSQYLGNVTSAAMSNGISFEETNAALAVMTQRGSQASSAVDGLRAMITQLSAPTAEAQKLLDAYGVQAGEAALRSKGLAGVVADLYQKTGGDKVALRRILSADTAVDAASKLVGPDNGALFNQRIEEFQNGDGATEAALAEQRKGLMFQLEAAKNAVEGFVIVAATGLMPLIEPVVGLLQKVTAALQDMPDSAKTAVGAFLGIAGAVATALGVLLTVGSSIAGLVSSLTVIGTAAGATGTGITVALGAAGTAISGFLASIAALAGPILAAIAVIVAAAAAVKYAWDKNWGGIQEKTAAVVATVKEWLVDGFDRVKTAVSAAWSATWRAVETGFTAFMEWIKPALNDVVAFVSEVWALIEDDYTEMMSYLVPIAKGALGYLYNTIVPALQAIWQVFKVVWSEVVGTVRVAWTLVKGIVVTLVTSIRDLFRVGMALVQGDWQGAWDGMKDWVTNFGVNVLDTLSDVWDTIKSALFKFTNTAYDAGRDIMQAFSDGLKGRERAVADAGTAVGEAAARVAIREAASPRLAAHLAIQERPREAVAAREAPRPKAVEKPTPAVQPTSPELPQLPDAPEQPKTGRTNSRTPSKLTTSQMLAYIRQHSDVYGDIANMQAASIEATYNLVQNATAEGIRLALTSGRRYGTDGSHHNAGNALDVQVPGYSDGSTKAGAIVRALAKGTGWQSGINEYLPQARAITGGTGPHVHLARALDGAGIPGHFRVDSSGGKKAGAAEYRRALEELARWREQVKAPGQDHETLAGKLAEVDARYAKMATEGQTLGASQADLAKVEAARQAERGKLLAEQAERERTLLAEMSAERLDLTADESEHEREELRKRFEAMVDHWQKVATETPALAAQAEQQVALIQRTYRDQRAEFERKAEEKRIQDAQAAWMQKHQKELESHEFLLKMGQETNEGLLAFLAQQLEAWEGTEEGKRTLSLRYREAFLEDLRVRREAQDSYDIADLERELAQLQAKTDLTVAEEIRRDALLAEVQEVQLTRLAEMRQRAQDVADSLRNSFQQAFTGVLSGQQSFAQGFKSIWDTVKQAFLRAIAEMIIKTQAFQAVLMALKAAMNAIGGFLGGLLGFHGGGVVGAPMTVPALPVVAHTGGLLGPGGDLLSFHSGGSVGRVQLRPDEVLAKLQTGEIVLSRDDVRDLGSAGGVSSGGGVSVVINAPGLVMREEADIYRFARALGGEAHWRLGLV